MLFKNKVNDNAVNILMKENERLKQENLLLRRECDAIKDLKEEYEILISDTKLIKKAYQEKLVKFNEIEKEYKKHLDKLLKSSE